MVPPLSCFLYGTGYRPCVSPLPHISNLHVPILKSSFTCMCVSILRWRVGNVFRNSSTVEKSRTYTHRYSAWYRVIFFKSVCLSRAWSWREWISITVRTDLSFRKVIYKHFEIPVEHTSVDIRFRNSEYRTKRFKKKTTTFSLYLQYKLCGRLSF